MSILDVAMTGRRALQKHPGAGSRFITDDGSQFVLIKFGEYLRIIAMKQVRTSVAY